MSDIFHRSPKNAYATARITPSSNTNNTAVDPKELSVAVDGTYSNNQKFDVDRFPTRSTAFPRPGVQISEALGPTQVFKQVADRQFRRFRIGEQPNSC